jgi:IMP cyclohydrolase
MARIRSRLRLAIRQRSSSFTSDRTEEPRKSGTAVFATENAEITKSKAPKVHFDCSVFFAFSVVQIGSHTQSMRTSAITRLRQVTMLSVKTNHRNSVCIALFCRVRHVGLNRT